MPTAGPAPIAARAPAALQPQTPRPSCCLRLWSAPHPEAPFPRPAAPPPPVCSSTSATTLCPDPCPNHQTPRSRETIIDIARGRTGWLVAFCIGLLLAAVVVEQFEDVLERHVELSFFVPLIMGHGGNTGSQSVTTVIR
jgi:hypothetical protein